MRYFFDRPDSSYCSSHWLVVFDAALYSALTHSAPLA